VAAVAADLVAVEEVDLEILEAAVQVVQVVYRGEETTGQMEQQPEQ
jgi:hypothetical protein